MTNSLRSAFEAAAATGEPYGDASAAIAAATRRRRSRLLGASAAVAIAVVAVIGGITSSYDSSPPPATTHPRPPASAHTTANQDAASPVHMSSPPGPDAGVLYRTCRAGVCTVGVVYGDDQHLSLPTGLATALGGRRLDGVTLSTDGAWVGYPRGGTFTVANVYDGGLSVDVPAGPVGSTWQPYFWTQGGLDLVLAQWRGETVTAFAIVHIGSSSNPELQVVTEPAPAGPQLLPTDVGASYYDAVSLGQITRPPSNGSWPIVSTLSRRTLYFANSDLGQPGLGPSRPGVDLNACMRDHETLIGPEGVPMTFPVAPETSSNQDGATIVFRAAYGSVVPTAVVNGNCGDPTARDARYNLPQSTYTDGWTFLGPVTHTSSLMLHGTDYTLDRELVVVRADGGRTVVGSVPFRTEVVAPGITAGQFD